ncbi:MAG TPA: tetratricopeptide repeat protein [Gemmatimonadales bacterium]|nr:tetratricopeptide repeat protein [Gemmatimonadales bacterium]
MLALIGLLSSVQLSAQAPEADQAWSQGRYEAARAAYQQVLARDPRDVRANLRLGVLLSWQGKLDSALVFIRRAREADPVDPEIRLIQARVLAWDEQYDAALRQYDSLLVKNPGLREAALGRARTLAWAGRLEQARSTYQRLAATDSTDRDALLGGAQVTAWAGDLAIAEEEYRRLLARNSRDLEARVGLGYVYLWQGRQAAAGRQASYVLAIDSTHKSARELLHSARAATRPSIESSAYWSNDSDENTSFWQTLTGNAVLGGGVGLFGSVNALETSDPALAATRVGAEAGLSIKAGPLLASAGGGARRLDPEIAPPRTAATYRARLSYRPVPRFGLGVGYARQPFDEIAGLFERELDFESLEGNIDVRPTNRLTVHGGAGALWLSDGNRRTSFSGGLNQRVGRRMFVGVFGRTLSFERRVVGYFSPDRFSVLEGVAGYHYESRSWLAAVSGGLGAQQVGERGAAQTEWHIDGRVGTRWGIGNRLELFGLITNSAVSSTTGAFRYRSAGLSLTLGL